MTAPPRAAQRVGLGRAPRARVALDVVGVGRRCGVRGGLGSEFSHYAALGRGSIPLLSENELCEPIRGLRGSSDLRMILL